MRKTEKKEVVTRFREELKSASLVVRIGFSGLKVEESNLLRRQMGEVDGTQLSVVKNTLATLAAKETDAEALFNNLADANAFLLSREDPVGPVKVLVEFAKKHKKLVIRDGILEGKLLDDKQVRSLADMPSREELLAHVLYTFAAPARGLVLGLCAVPRGLLNVLNALKAEKEKAA